VVNQLTITLEQPEYAALLQMAVAELRTPPDQLRHILRQELARRQLWPPAQVSEPTRREAEDDREREARQ
jgi:hypothetical protein